MTRLVLLPGLDGTGDLFAPFVSALNDQPSQIVAYAQRPMSYAEHEACARAKLPDEEDFVLLAESFSGPIGIGIAASRPARLRGLILCATFATNPLPVFAPLRRLVVALPAARIPAPLTAPWLYAGRSTPALRRAHAAAIAKVPANVINRRVAEILAVDQRAKLKDIDVPMLYLKANADRLVPATAPRAILELRPDMELREFDAPHFLLQTEPEACAAAVREFLGRCAP